MIGLQNEDLYATVRQIYRRGGAIFFDRVPAGSANATATGTAAARVSISTTYVVPNAAVELLAMAPGVAPTAAAAGDQIFGYADIQGTSFKKQPQQVLAPVGGVNLSVGAEYVTPQEWYTIKAPVSANDSYDWGFYSLIANAHNMKAWDDVMYATIPSGESTIYSQVQAVQTFTSAGQSSTGNLQLTAANAMYEIGTGVAPETVAIAQENQIISTGVQCSALDPIQSFNYGCDAPAVITATSGTTNPPQISRYMPLGLTFKTSSPTLNFTETCDVVTTHAVTVSHMVRYTSF